MSILGINDSANSGATLFHKGNAKSAVNEERFTGLKNDVGFPTNSINYLQEGLDNEIEAVALGWIGGNALVSRIFPSWDVKRRKQWRREIPKPSRISMHFSNFIYRITQNQNPKLLWKSIGTAISRDMTRKRLKSISSDLSSKKIYVVEHHLAHAASAYYPSGFKEALIVTLDGAGDGLSGTISIGDKGEIKRLAEFKASSSIGILYGAATLACDMRYNEDEGKLMSLAAYSYPVSIPQLKDFCYYDRSRKMLISKIKTRNEILLSEYLKDHILSNYDRESFAYAMQKHVEDQVIAIIKQWVEETKIHNVALAGGFFSNVKTNMLIEHLPEVKNTFIFPNMGDGGLSFGSAAYVDFVLNGSFSGKQVQDMYLGPSYSDSQIEDELKLSKKSGNIEYEPISNPAEYAADIIAEDNKIVLWFQGRMEYGPRALGNRSVLALPMFEENRNILNIIIKKRPYYQPFASTILDEVAPSLLSDYVYPNRFMTSANTVRDEHFKDLIAASHIDKTTRPQILENENPLYKRLIKRVGKKTGIYAVLNTSLNKHGKPIVLSPKDALWTLENTGADTLVIGNFIAYKKHKK
ncbi:MAG: carbamoyltransferase C-terminal domain-containing protein [Candidatus Micrarchaeia archaeon]